MLPIFFFNDTSQLFNILIEFWHKYKIAKMLGEIIWCILWHFFSP